MFTTKTASSWRLNQIYCKLIVSVDTRPHTNLSMRITLDTNCLIDLEQPGSRQDSVRELLDLHSANSVELHIPSIMASERQLGGKYYEDFDQFEARLEVLGLRHLRRLLPMGYFGIGFVGHMLWTGEEMTHLERRIHTVLHPEIEFEYSDYCAARNLDPQSVPISKEWRNRKCDVQVAWAHVYHGLDVLVTSDENFFKKSKVDALADLGLKYVFRPYDAVRWVAGAV